MDYLPGPGFRPWHFRLIWAVFCASSFLSAGCGRSRFSIKPAILMHGMPDAILDQNMREAAVRDGLHDLLLHSSHCLRFFCMTFCLSAHLASMVLGAHGTTTRKVFIDGLRCDPKKLLRNKRHGVDVPQAPSPHPCSLGQGACAQMQAIESMVQATRRHIRNSLISTRRAGYINKLESPWWKQDEAAGCNSFKTTTSGSSE